MNKYGDWEGETPGDAINNLLMSDGKKDVGSVTTGKINDIIEAAFFSNQGFYCAEIR